MTTNETAPAVANLRQTRKELAASKRRHPAGKAAQAKAPAVGKPAEKPAKTAEKKERKAPQRRGDVKLRWSTVAEKGDPKKDALQATAGDRTYQIVESGSAWKAVVLEKGKQPDVLADNIARGRAYAVLTDYHYEGKRPQAKKAPAQKAAS